MSCDSTCRAAVASFPKSEARSRKAKSFNEASRGVRVHCIRKATEQSALQAGKLGDVQKAWKKDATYSATSCEVATLAGMPYATRVDFLLRLIGKAIRMLFSISCHLSKMGKLHSFRGRSRVNRSRGQAFLGNVFKRVLTVC